MFSDKLHIWNIVLFHYFYNVPIDEHKIYNFFVSKLNEENDCIIKVGLTFYLGTSYCNESMTLERLKYKLLTACEGVIFYLPGA